MVTLILVVVAVAMALAVATTGYMMFTDRGLFNRLCAYNSFSACLTCLVEVLAVLFASVTGNNN